MVVTSTSCVMYCHVTSDTLGKDLAWCHLRSLWSGLTLSSLGEKKKTNHSPRKTLGRKTSGFGTSHFGNTRAFQIMLWLN